jgi:hypothetical protein
MHTKMKSKTNHLTAENLKDSDESKQDDLREKHKDIWRASMNFEDFFGKLLSITSRFFLNQERNIETYDV